MNAPDAIRSRGSARPGPAASLRPALVLITISALLLGGYEFVLLRYPYPDLVWLLGLLSMAGLLYVFAGVLAWDRRPSNRMGLWLVVVGMATLIARLSLVEDPLLATTGLLLAQAPIAGVVVLMLLFPSGRFAGRLDRSVAAAAVVITVGFAIPLGLFRPADQSAALHLADRPDLVAPLSLVQAVLWWALLAAVVVILVRRVATQRAVRGERRARLWVYLTGIVSVLVLPLVAQLGLLFSWSELAVFVVQVVLIALVPVVFTTSLLAGGYGRTGRLDELAAWLGSSEHDRPALRRALADTLGDDSLQLLFRRRASTDLVDEQGRPAAEPERRAPTAAVEIELSGGSAAVIAYDTAAVPDPQLVTAAGRIVAVALDRDRLTAELLAEREELKRSRTRIVEVGDTERRRLARDLHDGLQSRLVLAAIRAGTLAAVPDLSEPDRRSAYALRVDIEQSVQELRRMVHGVLPALLLERGLVPAARELVERCGIPGRTRFPETEQPIPPAVATNLYFVLAEAVTNAVKHANASQLDVSIDIDADGVRLEVADTGVGSIHGAGEPAAGGGLRGMADRVEALGGQFSFSSRRGQGSRVVAVIPYAEPQRVAA